MSALPVPHPVASAQLHTAYRGLIEDRFGLRLTDHQARDLSAHVMQLLELTDFAEPLEMCRAFAAGWRADLLNALVANLTVGETHFFRIEPQIEALRRVVLPDLIRQGAPEQRLRLWSAGCSTGEEPYTLAMLLREQLPATEGWDLRILATDVSGPALDAARRGVYGEWSFRGTPAGMRQRYFARHGKQWRLVDAVRRMVQFAFHNLADDALPGLPDSQPPFDLILCRNVTIYFSPTATQQVYGRFARNLGSGGWLVLGPSDPIPDQPALLESTFVGGAVLWRRAPIAERPHVVPANTPPESTVVTTRRVPRGEPPPSGPTLEEVRLLAHSGDRTLARKHAQRVATEHPLTAEAHLLLGMLALDEGEVQLALSSLRRAVFLDSADALAHFGLGRAWMQAGNSARARAALTDARRKLAPLAEDALVPGGGGIWAGELRHAIEAQLEVLQSAGSSA